MKKILFLLAASVFASVVAAPALAQGCLAVHTNQPMLGGLCSGGVEPPHGFFRHPLTVEIDWRSFSSHRHFIGTVEQKQREILGTEIENHQNLYNVGVSYELTPRWSVNANVPVIAGTRDQKYPPAAKYDIGGIGDMLVGVQGWVLRPPAENGGNVAFGASLKLPTGINDGKFTGTLANGQRVEAVGDQSMQPGDGSWGFTLSTQAYKQVIFQTTTYFQGFWLFNPRDTNGVPTFRTRPGEQVMSVPDQYLFRGGFAHRVPKLRGLVATVGGRMEGIPVRDAFGKSDGFRRPGYIISIDPGIMYEHGRDMLSLNGPYALERNRRASVTDLANHTHGDAAFADYTIILSYSRVF